MANVNHDRDDHTHSWWECGQCGREVHHYRGQGDVSCRCGAEYNAFGQRLRDDWRGNESSWNDEVGDMEGYEAQQLRRDAYLDGFTNG